MDAQRDVDDILRRRYWLKSNFEWFMNEVIFHKEMRRFFSDRRYLLWRYGDKEGKVSIKNETAGRPE
jgi:hypothetical protein